jgi:type IV pilus assembly protein PilE
MIVVAIASILASLVLPAYQDYVTRGKLVEATSTLSNLRIKLEQYYQDNKNYGSTSSTCGYPMPSAKYFTYSCNWGAGGADNQTYTVTATGVSTAGTGNFVYTIDQANTKASNTPWGNQGSCWVLKKGGVC